jgi:hypothetical protein
MPYSSTHRWWSILTGPQDVIDAIVQRDLPIRVAGEIARIDDAAERAEAIRVALAGGGQGAATAPAADKPGARPKKKKRAAQRLSFGGTSNIEVGRTILRRLRGSEPEAGEVKNLGTVAKAIRAEIAKLERELAMLSG